MQQTQKARLMRLSWNIQKRRKCNRSKALFSAWVIFKNEDITVYYLTRRFSHERYHNKTNPDALTLFGNWIHFSNSF